MKKTNIIRALQVLFVLSVYIVTLNSCHYALDIKNNTQISTSTMWQDESDAVAGMNGMYVIMRSAFDYGLIYWGDFRCGLWTDGLSGSDNTHQMAYQNKITSSHTYSDWTKVYRTINMANLVIRHTPDIGFKDQDRKNEVIANGYFVRAFCYFWIARVWGDAPLLTVGYESTDGDDLFPERSSAEEIFAQVNDDIESALEHMPDKSTSKFTASPVSINCLKADYHLWMYKVRNGGAASLAAATIAVGNVISNLSYGLEDSFEDVFRKEGGKEIVFAWCYSQGEYVNGYPFHFLNKQTDVSAALWNNEIPVYAGNNQLCNINDTYIDIISKEPLDQRTKVSYVSVYDAGKSGYRTWVNKFPGTMTGTLRVLDSDIPVYRYADALLMDAEIKLAKSDKNGAIAALNKIAKRAYGVEAYYPNSLTPEEVASKILLERQREFVAEGKLWWDFIRFGVAFDMNPYLSGREDEENVLLWPLSNTTLNRNSNLTQTPGKS